MEHFQPFNDKVLIRRHDDASSTDAAGLSIPDAAKEKPQEGTVIAVGPGHLRDSGFRTPIQCQPGDRVLFGKFAGTEITLDGQKLLLMHESELLGRIVTAQSLPLFRNEGEPLG